MGWHIQNVVNTVNVTRQVAKVLCRSVVADDFGWSLPEDVVMGGKLYFNHDHMEHMDFADHYNLRRHPYYQLQRFRPILTLIQGGKQSSS